MALHDRAIDKFHIFRGKGAPRVAFDGIHLHIAGQVHIQRDVLTVCLAAAERRTPAKSTKSRMSPMIP